MACDLTVSIADVCKDSLGGNSVIYLFNWDNADGAPFTLVAKEATAINAALTTVYEYAITGDLSTLLQNMPSDRNSKTTVNTQTLTLSLGKMTATKAAQLDLLAYGYPMAGVKDRNGNIHCIGIDDGIDFTIEAATGGAKTDANGYTLTGVSTTGALAPIMDTATAAAFIALVP